MRTTLKSLSLTAAALAVGGLLAPNATGAGQEANGIHMNGLTANGLASNGLILNGLTANGLTSNGTALSAKAPTEAPNPNRLHLRAVRLPGE